MEPLTYSVPDAAKALGVGRTKMWELVWSGDVRSFKVGAATRIERADLHAFMEAQKAAQSSINARRRSSASPRQ